MSEFTDTIMRETVAACAVDAHCRRRGPYSCRYYFGRDKVVQAEIERCLSEANAVSDKRERNFYEETFAAYGGDPHDLPWRRLEEKQRQEDEARRARLAANDGVPL